MAEEKPDTSEGGMTPPMPSPEMAQPKPRGLPRDVKINGESRPFGEHGLKHAILCFLDNLLAGNFDDVEAPRISFGSITLQLRRRGRYAGRYIAYGDPMKEDLSSLPNGRLSDIALFPSSHEDELENNLRKFALNNGRQVFAVSFGVGRGLWLWKKQDGGYGISSVNLPKTAEEWEHD